MSVSHLFQVLPNSLECFYNSIGARRTCFLIIFENPQEKKENNLFTLIIKLQVIFALAIISSTARATPVYKDTILNQSAAVFSLAYFLKVYTAESTHKVLRDYWE